MHSLSSDEDRTVVIDPVITMSTRFLTARDCTSRESNPGLYRGRGKEERTAVFESMEANYKQRGFTSSGKLVMSLLQASNPSSFTVHYGNSVNSSLSSSVASVSRQNGGNLKHPRNVNNGREEILASDHESIDAKAASYISSVRQRFRLE
ncbi:hypothetical protein SADUNF_Sadunf15G0086100 [Salix dunnii]|uniref:Uncharacterized protein n=1 Tax=Salix dunnii TaxID=1413687 RepID=A0A835MLA5_9ROSI|nr:hypothetical protein SADUNF_Sadunf15G0086100 [Salix dunnii]